MGCLHIAGTFTVPITCVTYMQYSALGQPYSAYYESNGTVREGNYIFDSEIASALWLSNNRVDNSTVYSDGREVARFMTAYGPNISSQNINSSYFGWNQTVNGGYIYLGHTNICNNLVIDMGDDFIIANMQQYQFMLNGRSTIYDDGGSRILW